MKRPGYGVYVILALLLGLLLLVSYFAQRLTQPPMAPGHHHAALVISEKNA